MIRFVAFVGKKNLRNLKNTKLSFTKGSLLLFAFLLLSGIQSWGQTTIVSDGLNNATTLFTLTNGAYYTGNSGVSDGVASSPFAIEGTHSRGVSNASATLTTTSNIDTNNYTGVSMSMRLASFSISNASNGADGTDIVTVEISPDGGTTYYPTVRVLGNANAYWAYTATGNANTAYDGNVSPVNFTPAGGGNRTAIDGYSTITITNLPSTTTLKVRITLLNDNNNERWVVDDFKITGTLATPTQLAIVNAPTTGTTGTPISSFTVEGRTAGNVLATSFTGTVTLTKASGSGNIGGTLSANAVAGIATFNNVAFDQASTYTITAASTGLTSATSGNVVISNPSTNIFGGDGVNFVGQINGYSQPINCTYGDYRVLNYRKVNTITTAPTDGRGQWVTTVNVQSSGGDVTPLNMNGGSGTGILFTSGGGCGALGTYLNKWAFGGVGQGGIDAINGATFNGSSDMGFNMNTTGRYTFVLKDNGYSGTGYYAGYTTNAPVTITHNTGTQRTLNNDGTTTITATISTTNSSQENFYVRYKTGSNDFSTGSSTISAVGSVAGTTVTLTIPVQADGATVYYYIFSSTMSQVALAALSEGEKSYALLNYADNSGSNYSYTALSLTPIVTTIVPTAVTGVTGQANNSGFKGQTITINGANFQSNSTVTINGVAATSISYINSSQLTAIVANTGANFTGNVVVANPTPVTSVTVSGFNFLGYITTGTGAINTASNWLGGSAPLANSTVTIAHIMTHSGGATTGTPFASLTIPTGGSLAVGSTGAVAVTNTITTSGTGSLSFTVSTATVSTGSVSNAGTLSWGQAGTLTINAGGAFTNTGTVTSSTFGNVVFAGAGTINGAAAITFNNLTINGTTTLTTLPTINGTLQINSGGNVNATPTYGSSSTLVYNSGGTYAVFNEWTGNNTATGSGVPKNVTIQNNTTLTMPNSSRGLAGNLNISSGNLTLNATSGSDLFLAGNWTRASAATFAANNRAVSFNGSTTQTLTVTGGGTETFNYLTVAGSGTLKLFTGTNINVNAVNGLSLSSTHLSSTIDLNGQTLTLSGGGNLNLNTGNRFITSTLTGGIFKIGANTTTVINPGTLSLDNKTTLLLENGSFDCGAGAATTVNGILQINTNGFITGNTPRYGVFSLLKYNTGGTYNRNYEWNGTIVPIGVPDNVQISNTTTLNYVNPLNLGEQKIVHNLTIDSGSKLYMDNGSVSCGGALNLGNDLISAGNMTLGYVNGDDLKIGGNITFNVGYNFDAKGRAVIFTKASAIPQIITASSKPTFHYVNLDGAATVVQLASGTSIDITAPNEGNVISFNNANNVFDINSNSLTLGTNGKANSISGSGTFKGSTTSNLTLLGTGSFGTLRFASNLNLGTFTMNREAAVVGCTMGSALTINTALNLTNGIVDLGANLLTLGSTSGSGTITGGTSASYIIADRTGGSALKRFTPTATSYFFPIGDRVLSAEGTQYSPATINLTTAGSLTTGSFLQLNVEDAIEPNNEAPVDFITRYWNLNGNNVSATYNFTGTYLPVDIAGTETNSKSGRFATSSGWTEGAALASNTVSLIGLTTGTGVISGTADSNHFSGGHPLKRAEINVKQGATTYLTGSIYTFANTIAGATTDVVFTIENLGTETLNLTGSTITGAEYSILVAHAATVSGNSTTTFTIRFAPTSVGTAIVGNISIANNDLSGSENPYVINFTGNCIASAASDIIAVASSSPATISSTVNTAIISSITDGVQVWSFTVRDGGGANDTDNLPTTLTALTISQGGGNSIATWTDAIQSVAIFDGNTFVANGVVSANTIVFSGISVVAPDNGSKTLTMRLSLNCPLGVTALDGNDFDFSITNGNTTFLPTGSGKASFTVASTPDNTVNFISVVAIQINFTEQPTTTAVNDVMSDVIITATDVCGNIDRNFTGAVSITSTGALTGAPISVNLINGVATFTNMIHTVIQTGRQLTATSGSLTNTSAFFDIVEVTVLSAGDLAIIAVNTNIGSSGLDQIAFICFKDINPGTKIYLTDNGYEREFDNEWGGTEGVISITRKGSVFPKGTIIVFESTIANVTQTSHFDIWTCGAIDNNWTRTALSGGSIGGFNLNSDDDVWILQGGTWINSTTHHSTYNGNVLYGWTESGWDLNPGGSSESTEWSTIYPGSNCFTTIAPTGDGKVKFDDPDVKGDFASSTNARLDWIGLINNTNNWDVYADNTAYNSHIINNNYNYKGNTLCPQLTIIDGTYANGVWTGRTDENWFNCRNWETFVVPNETVDVVVKDNGYNNGAKVENTALYASLYGNIAKTKNLSITGEKVIIEANANNKLEVHGNLTISGTGVLDMNDGNNLTEDGQLYVVGNWDNQAGAAAFEEGNGTVHLKGIAVQDVNAASGPETFYNLIIDNPSAFNTDNFHSDLIANANLELKSGADLTVKSGHYALAGKNLTVGVGSDLLIEDDASLVQTDDTGIVTNNGTTIVHKTTGPYYNYDYIYWSSPIVNTTIGTMFPLTEFPDRRFKLDAKNFLDVKNGKGYPQMDTGSDGYDDNGDDWVKLDDSEIMQPGVGYIAMGKGSPLPFNPSNISGSQPGYSVQFNGKVNNGIIQPEVNKDLYTGIDSNNTNINLVGNPYPSAIDIIEFYKENSSVLTGVFYFWTHDQKIAAIGGPMSYDFSNTSYIKGSVIQSGSDYTYTEVKNITGTTISPEIYRNIASTQGFMANVQDGINSPSQITFKNSMRVTGPNTSFLRQAQNTTDAFNRIWLNLTGNNGLYRQVAVGFNSGLHDGYSDGEDAPAIDSANDSDFYSLIPNNNGHFAIQFLGEFEENKTIPLGVEILNKGTYQISIERFEGVFSKGQLIFLEDKYMGIIHNLNLNPYMFESKEGQNINDRFVLRFTNTALGIDENTLENLMIYPNPSKGIFNLSYQGTELLQIEVYDLLGKKLMSQKPAQKVANTYLIDLSGYNTGIYLAKITVEGKQITRKLVVE